jgi:hypothetical protein
MDVVKPPGFWKCWWLILSGLVLDYRDDFVLLYGALWMLCAFVGKFVTRTVMIILFPISVTLFAALVKRKHRQLGAALAGVHDPCHRHRRHRLNPV